MKKILLFNLTYIPLIATTTTQIKKRNNNNNL
jgi:hypothetical protein